MRVSNEPCVPIQKKSRCELAHIRDFFWMGTYGECRDSERTSCVREPVGMAHCVGFLSNTRCELAHIRDFFWMGTYGEYRDRLIAQVSFLLNSAPIFHHRISC